MYSYFSWLFRFIVGLAYYALTLDIGKLAGDIYLNTFLTTLVELPGYLGLLFTLSTALGRSISISSAHIVTAVLLLASVPLAAGQFVQGYVITPIVLQEM